MLKYRRATLGRVTGLKAKEVEQRRAALKENEDEQRILYALRGITSLGISLQERWSALAAGAVIRKQRTRWRRGTLKTMEDEVKKNVEEECGLLVWPVGVIAKS